MRVITTSLYRNWMIVVCFNSGRLDNDSCSIPAAEFADWLREQDRLKVVSVDSTEPASVLYPTPVTFYEYWQNATDEQKNADVADYLTSIADAAPTPTNALTGHEDHLFTVNALLS